MINILAKLIIIYTLLASTVTYYFYDYFLALSVIIGGTVMLFNTAALAFLWKLIFFKKSIALAIIIIIFKYSILIMILWDLTSNIWIKPIGFVIGMASLVVSILLLPVVKIFIVKK